MHDFRLELAIQRIRMKKKFFQMLKKVSQWILMLCLVFSIFVSLPIGDGNPWRPSYVPILMIYPSLLFGLIIYLSHRVIRRMDATLRSVSLH